MSSITATADLPARPREQWSRGWIASPAFDLVFFILAPLVTLPIVIGAALSSPALAGLGIVLAFPHYFSSVAFYLWDENKAYHRSRWLPFFAGPLLLAALYVGLVSFRVPVVIQCAILFWNTWHVARQSCGILSIYRQQAGARDASHKHAANAAILSVSAWFAMWNVGTNAEVVRFFGWIHPRFGRFFFLAVGAAAAAALVRLFANLWLRKDGAEPPTVPELAFLGTSLLLFYPYLLIRDSGMATFVMLLPHYVQYLGIVWLVHRRRFPEPSGSRSQRALSAVSRSTPLLMVLLLSVGVGFLVFFFAARRFGFDGFYENVYLLIAFEHFYLDGLIWAFRNPHVRQTLGPYLVAARPLAGAR
ncbi:MAG: hypothetical protein ABI837_12325 [Acidobacteriota bacterium]